MKPIFENLTTENGEPLNIVNAKGSIEDWLKEQYKNYTWSQKIRVWIFNKLFKNKPVYGKITKTITDRDYFNK